MYTNKEVIMEIKQNTEAFYIGEHYEEALAKIEYINTDYGMILTHTEVGEELKGQGVGRALVKYVVEIARNEKFKLKLECTYAQKEFEKHPEYQDVLFTD
jgi:predicted GNAT family acetyltransferase